MGRKRGFTPGNKTKWTVEMIEYIEENWHDKTNSELAVDLGLTLTVLRMKLAFLGYRRMEQEYWTQEQIDYLLENYKEIGDVEFAEIFNSLYNKKKGWTKKHIEKKRRYLKLKRTEEECVKIKIRNKEHGRFSINHWRRWEGRSAPIGTIKIWQNQDGLSYKVIKTDDGYVHYARWLYESVNGPIIDGKLINFIDGNNLNVVIENMKLVTRAEHARNNTERRKGYPEELKLAVKTLNIFKKSIHEKQNYRSQRSPLRSA